MLRFLRMRNRRTSAIWWALIVITVVTFVGGFIFLFGSGFDSSYQARLSGAIGTVNGATISRTEYQNAVLEQREAYRRQYGTEPIDRDEKMLETQTWRSLVIQRLLAREAKREGLKAHDGEVVIAMQVTPPTALLSAPAFQTDGKFDPAKYQQALQDPNNNWSAFEDVVRRQIPMRKLQERLASSIKLSEPELRAAYRDRFEKTQATILNVPATTVDPTPVPSEEQLAAAYQQYGSRFAIGPRVQLEVLVAPKAFGEGEVKASRELAQSLADRARAGEDFATLVRDYSEAPNTQQGGVLDRVFKPSEFGPEIGPGLVNANTGDIIDPILDGGRFMVFKIVERPAVPGSPEQGLKLAQLVIRLRGNEEGLRQQFDQLQKIAKRAERAGLGRAATENGMATLNTGFFQLENAPQALASAPEAVDWAFSAKDGNVSPVFEGNEEYVVVQLAGKRDAGTPPRDEIAEVLRQIAVLDLRLDLAKPKADELARALASGQSLEQAARSAGLVPQLSEPMSRAQPDPRYAGSPELVGALFAARPGQVVGPIRTLGGWYFARIEQRIPADTTFYSQLRGQISTELLQRRQQTFLNNYAGALRSDAKIADLRYQTGN